MHSDLHIFLQFFSHYLNFVNKNFNSIRTGLKFHINNSNFQFETHSNTEDSQSKNKKIICLHIISTIFFDVQIKSYVFLLFPLCVHASFLCRSGIKDV